MIAYTNDGSVITQMGSCIHSSDGNTYVLCGKMLTSPGGILSYCCESMSEAIGIVIGLHGGRRF